MRSSLRCTALSSMYSPIVSMRFVLFAAKKSRLAKLTPTAVASSTFEVMPSFTASLAPSFSSGAAAIRLAIAFTPLLFIRGVMARAVAAL